MKTELFIQNLKCGGCANTIINKLSELNEISSVNVDVESSIVTFEHTSENVINTAVEKLAVLGYPVVGDKNTVISKAKSFVSCAVGRMSK
jgi:copper chaperone CopZ